MKKYFAILTIIYASLITSIATAHGSVSKNVGNAVVYLNQNPLSPFVNEKVQMAFIITNNQFQPIKNLDVRLTATDTFLGDASRDRQVFSKDFKTDENGTLTFEYSFPNPDYYDVELGFKDPITGENDLTGFLVQPRFITSQTNWLPIAAGAAVGFILGISIRIRRKPTALI